MNVIVLSYRLWQECVRERPEREDRNKESVWKTAFDFNLTERIERARTNNITLILHTHIADFVLKQNHLSLNPVHCSSQMEHEAAMQALQKELQGVSEKLTQAEKSLLHKQVQHEETLMQLQQALEDNSKVQEQLDHSQDSRIRMQQQIHDLQQEQERLRQLVTSLQQSRSVDGVVGPGGVCSKAKVLLGGRRGRIAARQKCCRGGCLQQGRMLPGVGWDCSKAEVLQGWGGGGGGCSKATVLRGRGGGGVEARQCCHGWAFAAKQKCCQGALVVVVLQQGRSIARVC